MRLIQALHYLIEHYDSRSSLDSLHEILTELPTDISCSNDQLPILLESQLAAIGFYGLQSEISLKEFQEPKEPFLFIDESFKTTVVFKRNKKWIAASETDTEHFEERPYSTWFRSFVDNNVKSSETISICIVLREEAAFASSSSHSDHHHLSPAQRLIKWMASEKREIGYIYLYAILSGILALSFPLGIQAIVSFISGGVIFNSVNLLITFVLIGIALSSALQIMQVYVVELMQRRLFATMAISFTGQIPKFLTKAVRSLNLPEQVNRFFDTLTLMKSLPKLLIDVSSNLVSVVFGLALMAAYHPFFVFYGLAILVMVGFLFKLIGHKGMASSIIESKYKYQMVAWLEDIAKNHTTFRTLPSHQLANQQTDYLLGNYLKARKKHFSVLMYHYVSLIIFKVLILGGLLIIGSQLVVNREITIGQFVASELVMMLIMGAVEKLILTIDVIYDSFTAVDKLGHFLEIESDQESDPHRIEISTIHNVEINNVETATFSISSLSIDKGQKVALFGFSKNQTDDLLDILEGETRPIKGAVKVNGHPVSVYHKVLYRRAVYKMSNNHLFEADLAANVSMRLPYIHTSRSIDACRKAGIDFASPAFSKGLSTPILPNEPTFSIDIRTRILLARLFAYDASLWLIEDIFSENSYDQIVPFIDIVKSSPSTVFITTNNPLVAKQFDRIFVNKDNSIIEMNSTEFVNSIVK
jgi:ABC-type bacteriocin/lantibiotic exporter with double-glycine peptidase domain